MGCPKQLISVVRDIDTVRQCLLPCSLAELLFSMLSIALSRLTAVVPMFLAEILMLALPEWQRRHQWGGGGGAPARGAPPQDLLSSWCQTSWQDNMSDRLLCCFSHAQQSAQAFQSPWKAGQTFLPAARDLYASKLVSHEGLSPTWVSKSNVGLNQRS